MPFWMKEMPKAPHINARTETVDSKPMFREAFAKRRCLIPATCFFEWQKRPDGKQPYRITRNLEPFAFAGVWEFARIGGEEIVSASIIVCDANDLVAPLHDRMPVILESADYDAWLDPATRIETAKALLKPCSMEQLQAYPVSRLVGSPKNDVPECIEAIGDPP